FEQAITQDHSNASSWNSRGVVLQILKRDDEAIDALNHALAIDPEYQEPLINKSSALIVL
ncbi:MAG: tetratricopeptide repeat protein, partial [Methanomicrobiales archaeon]